jgi:hypothetical protein
MLFHKLPPDIIRHVLGFLGASDATHLEITCKKGKSVVLTDLFWRVLLYDKILPAALTAAVNFKAVEDAKQLVMLIHDCLKTNSGCTLTNLESKILGYSSVDNETQGPDNVLSTSFCYDIYKGLIRPSGDPGQMIEGGRHAQSICRCYGPSACYWSSKPSMVPNVDEFLTFEIKNVVSCLAGFTITPYQAFFHPHAPVYSPVEVSLCLLRGDEVCFQSRRYMVRQDFSEQTFFLSQPVLVPNMAPGAGNFLNFQVRLVLHGMRQRQTLTLEDIDAGDGHIGRVDDYYMCLSRASIIGAVLPMVAAVSPTESAKPVVSLGLCDSTLPSVDEISESVMAFAEADEYQRIFLEWGWLDQLPYSVYNIRTLV